MNKKLLILFCIAVFINKIQSQTNWELLNPIPTGNTGKDIEFVTNNIGYIINSNELLETLDTGTTWLKKQNILSGNDMSFYNTSGYIVGNNGYVLKSTDTGVSWSQISTGFNDSFNTVNIVDEQNIILSSPNNIVKTNNGGISWQSLKIPNVTVNKTFFVNSLIGHAACNNGKLLKTIDGGQNWYVTQSTNTFPSNYFTVYFVNENLGFATKEHSDMYKTTDGGETWAKVTGINDAIYSLYFIDENTGYAVGEYGVIFRTINGGDTWSWASFQKGRTDNTSLYGIYFQDANIGYATGARGRIIKTTNGGYSWTEHSPTYNDIRKIEFINNNVAYTSVGGSFLKTTNSGNTWFDNGKPNYYPGLSIRDFDFVNENVGYAIIYGSVYKTINGGTSWSEANNGNQVISENLNSIHFIDESIGFTSGGFNIRKVLKTTDGANTWTSVLLDVSFGQIQFINSQIGYAYRAGYSNGRIYKTIDGGNTWNVNIEVNEEIRAFHFVDENNGYFVGDQGLIYKTINGGSSWQELNIPFGNYNLVKFYSEYIGFIADDYGRLYKTLDGGESWAFLTTLSGINSIELIDNYIFTGGPIGRIYRSHTGILNLNDYYLNNTKQICIFPNPATNFVNIKLENNETISTIELFDSTWKQLINRKNRLDSSGIIKMNLSSYEKGIYFLKVTFINNKTISKKLILN